MGQTCNTNDSTPLREGGNAPGSDFSREEVSGSHANCAEGQNPLPVFPRGVPTESLYHPLFVRVLNRIGQVSPRMAIKAQCLDCMGLDREAVAGCADRKCPLWHFRPYQKRGI